MGRKNRWMGWSLTRQVHVFVARYPKSNTQGRNTTGATANRCCETGMPYLHCKTQEEGYKSKQGGQGKEHL